MDATKGNGTTASNSHPAETHKDNTSSCIIAFTDNCNKPNLIARIGRAGHLVHEGNEQSFTVVHPRWGLSRHCEDFAALLGFSRIAGVRYG